MAAPSGASRRPPLLAAVDAADRAIGLVCRGVVVASGVGLLVAITVGVISRYVITVGGADWAEELPKQIFAWFIMAGVVLALQSGAHIAVDLIHRALPERGRQALFVGGNLLIAAAYLYLARVAWAVADIVKAEINPILGISGATPYWAVICGALLTALAALALALRVALLGLDAAPQAKPEESVQ